MIREAEHKDIADVVSLTAQFREENWNDLPFDPVFYSAFIFQAITGDQGTVFVFEVDGKVVGFIIGWLSKCLTANLLQAEEVFFYCSKQHRGRGSIKLFKRWMEWANQNGATIFKTASLDSRAEKFYNRMGFRRLESHYIRVI